MIKRKVFLLGALSALVGSLGVIALFFQPSNAQQNDPHHPDQNQTAMQTYQRPMQSGKMNSFKAMGASMVENVQITGVAVTGDNEISVSLRYLGEGESPGISAVAVTNPMGMMAAMHGSQMMGGMGQHGMMMGGNGMGMMQGGMIGMQDQTGFQQQQMMNGSSGAFPMSNSTQMMPWADIAMQSQSGSNFVQAGWESGAIVKVALNGETSAYDSDGIMVMVFPYLS